jgi:elongation factor G
MLAWRSLRRFSFRQTKASVSGDNHITSTKPINRIRNLGIIAHIDAGKTTVSERMLYYSGQIALPGEVHHGNTTMDYMEQERKRGITIRAATIAFQWEDHQINLIDTPGHVDFSAEVERSLRVCDGAVAVFDGMMGVETQSETVWQQANRFDIPRIGFINKMDRLGCLTETTTQSIKRRLKVEPILLNVPSSENHLTGLIDLVN